MKTIEVTINPDGTTHAEVFGACGDSCRQHTDALAAALGGEVVSDEKKPEFYQTTQEKERVRQGGW